MRPIAFDSRFRAAVVDGPQVDACFSRAVGALWTAAGSSVALVRAIMQVRILRVVLTYAPRRLLWGQTEQVNTLGLKTR